MYVRNLWVAPVLSRTKEFALEVAKGMKKPGECEHI